MANEQEIERWSGEQGEMWLAREEIRMVSLAPFGELLMSIAEPRAGEYVIDIGCGTGPTTLALAARSDGVTNVHPSLMSALGRCSRKSKIPVSAH